MRHIFYSEQDYLQQGSIFNGAVARGYDGCDVYGVIITPRCDIDKHKVSIVHYLPIVKFEDWKKVCLSKEYQEEFIRKESNYLSPFLKKYALDHLLQPGFQLPSQELPKLFLNKPVPGDFYQRLDKYWKYLDNKDDIVYHSLKEWNNYSSRISELVDGKMERYLFFEDWNGEEYYYVICLTEIYNLQLSVAERFKHGVLARDIDYDKNDLKEFDDRMYRYELSSAFSSPYMEYICQKFSNAFFRIGIDDWENRSSLIKSL